MDLQLTKPGRCRKYCKSTSVYGEFIREGRMKKSRSENVKIIGENGKADVTFTWEKHRDGSANLVGQIMVGLFSKLSSHQISVVADQGESAKNGITEWVGCLFWHFRPEL